MSNNNELSQEEKDKIGNTIEMLKKRGRGVSGAKSSAPPPEESETGNPNFAPVLKEDLEPRPSQVEIPEPAEEKEPPVTKSKDKPKVEKKPPAKKKKVDDDESTSAPVVANGGTSLFDDSDFDDGTTSVEPSSKPDSGVVAKKPTVAKKTPAEEVQPMEKTEERGLVWSERMKKIGERYVLENREVTALSRRKTDGTKVKTGASFTVKLSDDSEYGKINAGVELPACIEDLPEAFAAAWKMIDKELHVQALGIEKSFSE